MTILEVLGYLGLALLLASSAMRTIIWLRILAIGASLVVVVYGILAVHYPAAVFGIVLLGINVDAIVVGENVYYYRQGGMNWARAAVRGAGEISMPVTFSVLRPLENSSNDYNING